MSELRYGETDRCEAFNMGGKRRALGAAEERPVGVKNSKVRKMNQLDSMTEEDYRTRESRMAKVREVLIELMGLDRGQWGEKKGGFEGKAHV